MRSRTIKLYLCYSCVNEKGIPGRPFQAAHPKCPKCKLDGSDPRYAHMIVQRKPVHFMAADPVCKGVGCGRLACGKELLPGVATMYTGHAESATCPVCRDTDEWKAAFAADTRDDDEIQVPDHVIVGDEKGIKLEPV